MSKPFTFKPTEEQVKKIQSLLDAQARTGFPTTKSSIVRAALELGLTELLKQWAPLQRGYEHLQKRAQEGA